MKVLLLDPKDRIFAFAAMRGYDLIVDFGRAPVSTYSDWSARAGCRVISLFDFAEEIQDLRRVKALLAWGMGQIVDQIGIDWWDVTSILILDDLLRLILAGRLSKQLPAASELYSTRPGPLTTAIERSSGGKLHNLETRPRALVRRLRHYPNVVANLDSEQLIQVIHDKFDPQHKLRRRWNAAPGKLKGPLTLLPSGYVNVSRTAVAYAAMLPAERFLLVCARSVGRLRSLPENVTQVSLDPYFVADSSCEVASLLRSWERMKSGLISSSDEFAMGEAIGMLNRVPALIRSGVAMRDAWNQVFERQDILACFCADDTAPYTRVPLILAKNRKIPAIACHHGALDSRMAVKTPHADFYLAKGEMDRAYLSEICQLGAERIVTGAPPAVALPANPGQGSGDKSWLVFFTEPYEAYGWRRDEVYRDLLPGLVSLAATCNRKLILKLHPFESRKSVRRLFRRHISRADAGKIEVVTGAITPQIWENAYFAITVQSTVAMECHARGIPVFLCGWLRETFGGYVRQFARFGLGHVLDSSAQLADIPLILKSDNPKLSPMNAFFQPLDPQTLYALLHGTHALSREAI